MTIISTPAELTPTVLNRAVGRYYKELQDYARQADHELALRPAFQSLLAEMARKINLTLVHEMTIRGRIRPDGVLCNAFHIQRGYWEAKGPKGNLEDEIRQKVKDGYPLENALFESLQLYRPTDVIQYKSNVSLMILLEDGLLASGEHSQIGVLRVVGGSLLHHSTSVGFVEQRHEV